MSSSMSSLETINPTSQLNALPKYSEKETSKTIKAGKKKESINVNGLEKAANSLVKKAEAALSKHRQVNTARRANMAENIESNARKELRLGKTILNLAGAIKAGKSRYLAGIRSRSQVQVLEYMLRAGKGNRSRQLKYVEWDTHREVEILDIDFVKYPYPWVSKHNFKQLNLLGQKIAGISEFLVDLNTLFTSQLKKQDSDNVYFDSQEKISLLRNVIEALKEDNSYVTKSMADSLIYQSQDCEVLQNLGIKDLPTLIDALKEYFEYRSNQVQESPIKRLERELIGLKIPNYFPTPKKLIEKMLDLADIDSQENLKILEPSAGSGHLADEIKRRVTNCDLSVIEINHHLKEILEAKGHNLVAREFLYHKKQYSIIIMNPPFSDGEAHLQHAYELLYPGGRVVSIMGEGSFFRTDKKTLEFRDWFESVGGYSEKLPDGSFLNSDRPTGVATRIVLITKPADSVAEVDTSTIPDNSKIDDSTTINPVINSVAVNPNLETLSEAAKDIAEKAESILAQDIEVKTYEQAIIAKSVDFEARKQLQLASTIASIVQAIQSGKTHFLSSIKDQCDVEVLENLLQQAKHQRPKQIGKVLKDCEPELTDLDLVRYPYPILTMLILGKVSEIKTVEGLNTITTRFAKLVDVEAKNRGYLIFKEPSQIKDFEEMVNLVKPVNSWLEEMLMVNEKLTYYKTLQSLGLTDLPTLVEGLKEYLALRIDTPKINPIKALELHVMGIGIEGYFYTPKAVVAKMLDFTNIQADTKILNAFAGAGNIADGIKNLHPTSNISVIEIDWKLKEVLTAKGYNIVDSNVFEHQENYQLVLMNPPNRHHYDITCFYQAYNLLVPGGKLVSIISEESFSSNSDYSIGFRKWLKRLGGISQILPDGSLIDKLSSTNIAARIVVVDKSSLF